MITYSVSTILIKHKCSGTLLQLEVEILKKIRAYRFASSLVRLRLERISDHLFVPLVYLFYVFLIDRTMEGKKVISVS